MSYFDDSHAGTDLNFLSSSGHAASRTGHTFFVHDTTGCQNEEDPPEDMICYFSPSDTTSVESQSLLMGAVSALIVFAEKYSLSPARIIRMEREKMSILRIDHYHLCLCGSLDEPDTALINQLDSFYGAFRFYHGSFGRVKRRCNGDRRLFLDEMKKICEPLLGLVERTENILHPAFNPTPFTHLPACSSRHFLAASQILQRVRRYPGVLAGAILYENTALCSDLPTNFINWIVARKTRVGFSQLHNATVNNAAPQTTSVRTPSGTSTPTTAHLIGSPPLSSSLLLTTNPSSSSFSSAAPSSSSGALSSAPPLSSSYTATTANPITSSNVTNTTTSASSTSTSSPSQQRHATPQQQQQQQQILFASAASAALTASALTGTIGDVELSQRGVTLLPVFLPYDQLTQLRRDALPAPFPSTDAVNRIPMEQIMSGRDGEFVGLYIQSFGALTLCVIVELYLLYDFRAVEKLRQLQHDSLVALNANLRVCFAESPLVYAHDYFGHVCFDGVAQTLSGSLLTSDLVRAVATTHDILAADKTVSQVVLGDDTGSVLAQRTFDRENYVMLPGAAFNGRTAFRNVIRLETLASETLICEHGQSLV